MVEININPKTNWHANKDGFRYGCGPEPDKCFSFGNSYVSGNGYGSGSDNRYICGYGSGSGFGYGDGSGSGSGFGDGRGSGYGKTYGYGNRYGSGEGYGKE
jgi:hypothetical protein